MDESINKNHRSCPGCGAQLQSTDPSLPGYVPASAMENEKVICKRCFRILHYNEVQDVLLDGEDFRTILNHLADEKILVVSVVDIFDLEGSWVKGLARHAMHNPILLVANKVDLLPRSTNYQKVKRWLVQSARELGVQPIDVVLVSAERKINVDQLLERIEELRDGRDVYVVGTTNVGKSTLINRIIQSYNKGLEGNTITTSHFPGTTLDRIAIPLPNGGVIYDTPGLINHEQIAHLIDVRDLSKLIPHGEIKPRVFQLQAKQTLFFGGLARVDFVEGERQSMICYLSNDLQIHRTKMENAENLLAKHWGELLSPPRKEQLAEMPTWKRHRFSIGKQELRDIVIHGLGWVAIKGTGAMVDVYVPEGVGVSIRPSII